MQGELGDALLFALLGALGVADGCLSDCNICKFLFGVDLDARLRGEELELDVFFGHSLPTFLLLGLEHFLVNLRKLIGHLSSFSHALHELLEEVFLPFVLRNIFDMGHDMTALECDGADCLGEFVDVWLTSLHRLHICLQLEHKIGEVTLRVFDVRIGWQNGEVRGVHENIRHSCVLETNDTSIVINALCLRIAVANYIVPARQSCDGVFNGIFLSFVGWCN